MPVRGVAAALPVGLLVLAGCGGMPFAPLDPERGGAVPPGGQVVHVTATDHAVTLTPETVRAGDVYLVIDAAPNDSIVVVGGAGPGLPADAPLMPGALERLARGDVEGTSSSGFDAGGCGADQDAADRGKLGPCGNVARFVVRPGMYAIMAEPAESNAGRASPAPIGVLSVAP